MTSEKKVLALSIIAFVFNFALVVVLILDQKVPRVRLCCHTNDSCTEEIKKLSPKFKPIKGKPSCEMYGDGQEYKIIDVRLTRGIKQLKIKFLFYRMVLYQLKMEAKSAIIINIVSAQKATLWWSTFVAVNKKW